MCDVVAQGQSIDRTRGIHATRVMASVALKPCVVYSTLSMPRPCTTTPHVPSYLRFDILTLPDSHTHPAHS